MELTEDKKKQRMSSLYCWCAQCTPVRGKGYVPQPLLSFHSCPMFICLMTTCPSFLPSPIGYLLPEAEFLVPDWGIFDSGIGLSSCRAGGWPVRQPFAGVNYVPSQRLRIWLLVHAGTHPQRRICRRRGSPVCSPTPPSPVHPPPPPHWSEIIKRYRQCCPCGWDLAESGWDLAEWLGRLTANARSRNCPWVRS
jgi:hypothetical protein